MLRRWLWLPFAALTLACAALAIASRTHALFWQNQRFALEIMAGTIDIMRGGPPSFKITDHLWPWRNSWSMHLSDIWQVRIPLYAPTLALAALTAALFYLRRTRRKDICPHCHYNLTGLPAGAPCPECGRPNSAL